MHVIEHFEPEARAVTRRTERPWYLVSIDQGKQV